MSQMPLPDREESLKNEVPLRKSPESKKEEPSLIEETTDELRDALSGILMACQGKESEIKNGEDFRERLNDIKEQTNKEQIILLQIYRAFRQAKPELIPTIGDFAGILLTAFKNEEIRPGLSTSLAGLSPEILIEIASEKFKGVKKKEQKRASAEILGEMHPIRIKTMKELEQEIEKIPDKTEKEILILKNLVKGIEQASDSSLFDLTRRILTAFYHTLNRPKITEALEEMSPEEMQKLAVELLGVVPQKADTGRVSIDAVREILEKNAPTNVISRSVNLPSDEASIDESPRAKEEAVTRKIVTRTVISAVLNSGHLEIETEKLLSEKIITKETKAYELLSKIHKLLTDLEKKSAKEKSERAVRFEIALKDFAGKLIKTLKKSNPEKNVERFRILSKLLHHTGEQLELLSLIMTPKRTEDIKIIEGELKANAEKLTRWTMDDGKRLARARTYFETGEKTMEQAGDKEKKDSREERFKNALEDCSSLIVIGLSSSEKDRSTPQFQEKTTELIEQIEVDAQGLEVKDMHDESTVIDASSAHVTEHSMDPEEKKRITEALQEAQTHGMKDGLTKANRKEKMMAAAEARKAKEAGLLDFGNVEDMLASALGE